ncbi:MAG TPA: diacylglycerol kinase family protein [Pyrinomonadaceae bacterium]|nr:diacylglycerol kinase family protein [Pyrinomonadaceae bacterium]
MPRKPLIIINNVAAKARQLWPIIRANLEQRNLEYDSYETKAAGDATVQTRSALKAGTEVIAVVGGDGSLSEAAAGFFELGSDLRSPVNPQAALAILPSGTGDDFARGLRGRRELIEYWIEILVSYCRENSGVRAVDVLHGACDNYSTSFICLNASTMGIGGETAARVAAQGSFMRRFSGEARFAAAAVGALGAWRERRVRVTVDDDEVVDGPMNLVAVANGLYAGGGMMLSPRARIDDGKLDVVTASGFSRAMVVRELPRIHSGGHAANRRVRIMQGERVRIETFSAEDAMLIEADGNVRGKTPVEFRILPKALRFVA